MASTRSLHTQLSSIRQSATIFDHDGKRRKEVGVIVYLNGLQKTILLSLMFTSTVTVDFDSSLCVSPSSLCDTLAS
jgi:hypothetical protein